jgi:hypothetical protein
LEKRKGRRDAGGTKEEKADPSPRKNREVRDDRVEQISAGASESRGHGMKNSTSGVKPRRGSIRPKIRTSCSGCEVASDDSPRFRSGSLAKQTAALLSQQQRAGRKQNVAFKQNVALK